MVQTFSRGHLFGLAVFGDLGADGFNRSIQSPMGMRIQFNQAGLNVIGGSSIIFMEESFSKKIN
jgi:hypothetical protein